MANFAQAGVVFKAKDFNKFISNFEKANSAFTKFNRMIDKSVSAINKWEAALRKVGSFLSQAFIAGLTAAIVSIGALTTAGVGLAASFENAFADVTKTVDVFIDRAETARSGVISLTAAGEEFQDSLIGLSNRIPVAFEELAAIAGLGGQLGVINDLAPADAQKALLAFTETVAGLAEATNLTQEIAGTGLAQISNVYRETIDDIGENIERLGSTIVELGNTSATTESKILNFTSRIAGASQTIGILQPEMLGIATAFSSIGITAEAGSTAVNRAFLIMNEAVNESSETFTDNSAAIAKTEEALSKLNAKLVRAEQGEEGLARTIQEQRDAFLEAGGAVEDFGRKLGDARREQLIRTQDEVDRLTQKLAQLKVTQGLAVSTEVFDEFLRVINKVRIGTELTGEEFKKLFKEDPAEAFTLFIEGLATEGDRAGQVLKEIGLGSVEAQRAFLAIAGASDTVRESIERAVLAFEENVALAEEVSTRYATLVSRLTTFRNIARNTAAELFAGMIPSLIAIVKEAGEVIRVFGIKIPQTFNILKDKIIPELNRAFGEIVFPDFDPSTDLNFAFDTLNLRLQALDFTPLGDKLIAFRDGPLATLKEGIALFRENADLATAALRALATFAAGTLIFNALTKLTGLLVALTSPVGLLLAGVATLGIAWDTNFMGMRDTTSQVIGDITAKITELWEIFQTPPGFEGSLLTGEVADIPSGFSGVLENLGLDKLASAFEEIKPKIDDFIEKMGELWAIMQAPPGFEGSILTGEVSDIPSGLDGVLETLGSDNLTTNIGFLATSLTKIKEAITGIEPSESLRKFLESLSTQVNLFFATLDIPDESVASFIEALEKIGLSANKVLDLWSRLLDLGIGAGLAELVNVFSGNVLDLISGAITIIDSLLETIQGLANLDSAQIMGGLSGVLDGLNLAIIRPLMKILEVTGLDQITLRFGQLIADFITQSIESAKNADFSGVEDSITELFFSILDPVWDNIQIEILTQGLDLLSGLQGNFQTLIGTVVSESINTQENASKIGKALQDLLNELASDKFLTEILADIQIEPPDFSLIGLKVVTSVTQMKEAFKTALFGIGIEPPSFQPILDKAREIIETIQGWMTDLFDFDIPFLPEFGAAEIEVPTIDRTEIDAVAGTLANGIIEGLDSEKGRLEEAWEDWIVDPIKEGVDAAEDFMGIDSPSTLMIEFGKDIVEGFVQGLQEQNVLAQEIVAMANLVTDTLIPAKEELAEINDLVVLPSVERLSQAERELADVLSGNVNPALLQVISTKNRLKDQTKSLRKEVDKITKSYLLLAAAIKEAVTAGSGSIAVPGATPAAAPAAGGPEFQSGGSFIVPPSVGPEGMQITVHPKELVQIIPADSVKHVVSIPNIMPQSSSPLIKSPIASNITNNTTTSGDTVTNNKKEFHLHVQQQVGSRIADDFELLEALS